MGGEGPVYWEEQQRRRKVYLNEVEKNRHKIAKRIVKKVATEIINIIIRPGPKPEERECTTVAQEIRDYNRVLVDKVVSLIPYEITAKIEFTEQDEEE